MNDDKKEGSSVLKKVQSFLNDFTHKKHTQKRTNDSSHDQALPHVCVCVCVCACLKSGKIMFRLHTDMKEIKKNTETMMMSSFSWKRYSHVCVCVYAKIRRLLQSGNGKKVSTYVNIT